MLTTQPILKLNSNNLQIVSFPLVIKTVSSFTYALYKFVTDLQQLNINAPSQTPFQTTIPSQPQSFYFLVFQLSKIEN